METVTKILPKKILAELRTRYRDQFGLTFAEMTPRGTMVDGPEWARAVWNLPVVVRSRAHALGESIRWGEAYVFFVAPGVLSWVVPVFVKEALRGGLVGGDIYTGDLHAERTNTAQYLTEAGGLPAAVDRYVRGLPVLDIAVCSDAARQLMESLYALLGWPQALAASRIAALQQREIAEALQERKRRVALGDMEEERMLLSLIRVGDRTTARRVLNERLATMFMRSPRIPVLKARVVEMLGYLVRTAVEDSPLQETLLDRHLEWLEHIFEAHDFERLCVVVRDCLDDFMTSVYRQGFNTASVRVQQVLDHVGAHYRESLNLAGVARALGMSKYHVAHIVKDATGRTVLQHVKRLRIDEACRQLRESDAPCAGLAYELGFTDQSHFTRQFRELTGTTPARYRKRHRG